MSLKFFEERRSEVRLGLTNTIHSHQLIGQNFYQHRATASFVVIMFTYYSDLPTAKLSVKYRSSFSLCNLNCQKLVMHSHNTGCYITSNIMLIIIMIKIFSIFACVERLQFSHFQDFICHDKYRSSFICLLFENLLFDQV